MSPRLAASGMILVGALLMGGCTSATKDSNGHHYGPFATEWLAAEESVTFLLGYTASDGVPEQLYVSLPVDGHAEIFGIDSGSIHTWVSPEFSARRNFGVKIAPFNALGLGGVKARFDVLHVRQTDVGFASLSNWLVLRGEIPAIASDNALWAKRGQPPVVGLLGADFLFTFNAVIEFGARTITFSKKPHPAPPSPKAENAPPDQIP